MTSSVLRLPRCAGNLSVPVRVNRDSFRATTAHIRGAETVNDIVVLDVFKNAYSVSHKICFSAYSLKVLHENVD